MEETWKPNVTVAAVIERDGRYLLVEEESRDGLCLNQPAGHLEAGESLLDAVVRETLEETACRFTPDGLLGVYQVAVPTRTDTPVHYLRVAFCGSVGEPIAGRALDTGIVRALWMDCDEIASAEARHRSPLVMRCIEDHRSQRARGRLELFYCHPSTRVNP